MISRRRRRTTRKRRMRALAFYEYIFIFIFIMCVCNKTVALVKNVRVFIYPCVRVLFIENFIHSESCLAVHPSEAKPTREFSSNFLLWEKTFLLKTRTKNKLRHFLRESTHHDVAAFSHPRSANQEERKTAEKSVNVYVSAFFFFVFFLLLQKFARSSRCRFFNKNSHRKRHHPATPFS